MLAYRPTLSGLTLLLGLVGLVILLQGWSDDPSIPDSYPTRSLLVIVAYALGMAGAAWLFTRPFPRMPALLWLGMAMIGLLFAAWLPFLNYNWVLNVTLRLSVTWLVCAALWKSQADLPRWRTWAKLMLGFLIVVNVLSLLDFPLVQMIDEGWNANLAVTFLREGVLYTRINQGIFGIPERFVPVANVLPGYWFALAGIGLLQARVVVLAGGMVLLALTYAVALRLYRDRDVALLAVVLLAGSYTFLLMSHLFRLDIYVAVSAMAALYLFLRAERQPLLALAGGFILAAGVEIHQNAAVLAAASGIYLLGAVVVASLRAGRLTITRREIAFIAGGVLGSLVFVAAHVLPNPSDFAAQFTRSMSVRGTARQPDWTDQLGWLGFLPRAIEGYLPLSPSEVALCIIGFFAAGAVRQSRAILVLCLVILFTYGILAPTLTPVYLINFWPLIALMCARTLWSLLHNRRVLVLAVCVAVTLPSTLSAVEHMSVRTNMQLIDVSVDINATLQPDERVVALHSFFLLMPNPPELIAPFMHDYADQNDAALHGLDLWRSLAPDVFVVAPVMSEPTETLAEAYRAEQGFVEIARYTEAGCCILVYRRGQ